MQQDLQADIAYFRHDKGKRSYVGGGHVLPDSNELTWVKGETVEQYQKRVTAAGHKLTPRLLQVEIERVRRETRQVLERYSAAAFSKLHGSMPGAVRALMEPSRQSNTLPHMPHLGFAEVLNLNAIYPNGARSRLRFVTSNFEADAVIGRGGLQFRGRSGSVDDAMRAGSFFIYGRRIREDGSIGEIDPVFVKDGAVYRPTTMKDVAATLLRLGNMTVIAERRLWVEQEAKIASVLDQSVAAGSSSVQPQQSNDIKDYDPYELVIPISDVDALPSFQ